MKRFLLFVLTALIFSCSTSKRTVTTHANDDLYLTRRYIGKFVDYRHTGPEVIPGTDLIWIKTSADNSFGRLSAYGKTCDFSVGDRIYLRNIYSTPGAYGLWGYQIENDSAVCYRVSEYKYENRAFVRAWSQ